MTKYGAWVETVSHTYHEVEAASPEEATDLIRTGKSVGTDTQVTWSVSDVEEIL